MKAIARHAFVQHLGLECLDLKEKAGSQVDSIVSDVENLLRAVGTYAQFESVFTSPEDIDRVRCAGILWCRTESHQCLCAIAGPCFRKAMTRLSGLHRS